ncbi:MAG: hypothetical protein JNL12_02095 [Planctomycetes bacterium]|nr:hypothetical protein [Planctomycetota bacterium]
MERRFSLSAALVALVVGAASANAQQPEAIGEHGALVELAKGWKRTRFDEDLLCEQLVGTRARGFFGTIQVFVLVREHLGLLENERDYWRLFEELEDLPRAPDLTIVDEGTRRRVSKQVDKDFDTFRATFRSELLVVDGYAMHVMCWCARSERGGLAKAVDELVEGIELPADESAKRQGLRLEPQRIECGDVELALRLRPFVMRPYSLEGSLRSWRTADEGQGLMVMELAGPTSLEEAVDNETETQRGHATSYREVHRTPRQIDGFECIECVGVSDEFCYRGLVVPAGDGRWLLLRHWARGGPTDARPDRDAIFASIQLRPRPVPNLPPLPPAAPMPFPSSDATQELVAGAVRRLVGAGHAQAWLPDQDGAWFRVGYDGIDRCVEGKPAKRLMTSRNGTGSVAIWNDRLIVPHGLDGTVQSVAADGTTVALPFSALGVAALGDALLCVRHGEPSVLSAPGDSESDLWVRRSDGSERRFASVRGLWGQAPVASGTDRFAVAVTGEQSGFEVAEFDLTSGERVATTRWSSPPWIGTATVGWLVNGAPWGRAAGLWHLQPGGALRLLVPGPYVRGVHLAADGLWISTYEATGSGLVFAPLELVDRVRARFPVPDVRQLEAVGEAFVRELGVAPRTQAEVEAALSRLQQLAQRELGHALPIAATELDVLLASVQPTTANGRIVYVLLLAGSAMANGAEWVASRNSSWLDWVVAADTVADHPFAIARHLPSAIVTALDDSEGDFAQAVWLGERRAGRRYLCGVDGQALAAASEAIVPAEFHAAQRPGELMAMARTHPENRFLRSLVYARLDRAKAWQELAELALEAVAAKWPEAVHHVAWLQARDRLRTAGSADPEFEKDLLAALGVHGREARLWWLLARSCERTSPPEVERARVCYERVLEVEPYGDPATAAKAALQRLTAK